MYSARGTASAASSTTRGPSRSTIPAAIARNMEWARWTGTLRTTSPRTRWTAASAASTSGTISTARSTTTCPSGTAANPVPGKPLAAVPEGQVVVERAVEIVPLVEAAEAAVHLVRGDVVRKVPVQRAHSILRAMAAGIVDRLGPRVVDEAADAVPRALYIGQLHGVVVGVAGRPPDVGEIAELREGRKRARYRCQTSAEARVWKLLIVWNDRLDLLDFRSDEGRWQPSDERAQLRGIIGGDRVQCSAAACAVWQKMGLRTDVVDADDALLVDLLLDAEVIVDELRAAATVVQVDEVLGGWVAGNAAVLVRCGAVADVTGRQ